jgi:hypothetical protein
VSFVGWLDDLDDRTYLRNMTDGSYRKAFLGFGGAASGASLATAIAVLAGITAIPAAVPLVGAALLGSIALLTDRGHAPPSIDGE